MFSAGSGQEANLVLQNLTGLLACGNSKNVNLLDNESHLLQKVLDLGPGSAGGQIGKDCDTVLYRLSKQPDLYAEESQIDDLFKGQEWQQTDGGDCWICNGHKTMLRELKLRGQPEPNFGELLV